MSGKVGKPRKYPTIEELKLKIEEYFNYCDAKKEVISTDKGVKVIYKPYTVSGLCLFLDLTREGLREYENRDEYSDTVKRAKTKIENWIEEHSLTGDLNPTISIFNLKNNFGWKDKHEVEQNVTAEVVTLTREEKEKKLKDLKERLDGIYEDD